MRVTRDIHDKTIAKWLESVPEGVLAALKEEAEMDEELAAAIQHSLDNDDPKGNMSAVEFFTSVDDKN